MSKHLLSICFGGILFLFHIASGLSQSKLPEEVVFVPKKLLLGTIQLETTIFKPDGQGPFPLAVINHGKSAGITSFQGRYRPLTAVRYFLERNYVVMVPMRQGFSKSGGMYSSGNCSIESNGSNQAEDIQATIDYAHQLPYVDKNSTLVVGQSHGGWTTLAYGANKPDKSVKGLVNFAGGLKNESCTGWQSDLYRTSKIYGEDTKIPSIWFYGDNDSYFPKDLYQEMFTNYHAGNPNAVLIAYGMYGSDSHQLFGDPKGRVIWEKPLDSFLQSIQMPYTQVNKAYEVIDLKRLYKASGYASISDINKLPKMNDGGIEGYKTFLTKSFPKAFVIGKKGNWAWQSGSDDPVEFALNRCAERAKESCQIYAVDDLVVWPIE